jgi:hypothetical protein
MIAKALRFVPILLVFGAAPLIAQSPTVPTPEGTEIRNRAAVSYTDANNNAYTDSSTVSLVTVGYKAAVDVTSAGITVPSPATGQFLPFTVTNAGNGTDKVSITLGTVSSALTVTGYRYGGVEYGTLSELNAALSAVDVAQGASIVVEVKFDVASLSGGTHSIELTATTVRTPTVSDSESATVTATNIDAVLVTAQTPTVSQRPNTDVAAPYTVVFRVANNGAATRDFTLTAAGTGPIGIVGFAPGSPVTIAAGAYVDVTVSYTVALAALGATGQITLTATQIGGTTPSSSATTTVTVTRPLMTMAKAAYRETAGNAIDLGNPVGSGSVLPGEYIWYRVSVRNVGNEATKTGEVITVTDALDAQLEYISAAGDVTADWTIAFAAPTVTATLNMVLPPNMLEAAARFVDIRVRVR